MKGLVCQVCKKWFIVKIKTKTCTKCKRK